MALLKFNLIELAMSLECIELSLKMLMELTTFQHIANSRNIFAKGALQAARWIHSRESGEYSFADFLNKKL